MDATILLLIFGFCFQYSDDMTKCGGMA